MKRIIETDEFPFEYISKIAEKESWRKDINRPIYHLHKWWAKRLGSVFRSILLGCALPKSADLLKEFYSSHDYKEIVILDPFMGGGTTIGEALKLGMTAYGKDINPVAAETVRMSLSPINLSQLNKEFEALLSSIGNHILNQYRTVDSQGKAADVLYYFWVMQSVCGSCSKSIDLFSDYILSHDAYPKKKPKIQVICPCCGNIFEDKYFNEEATCPKCDNRVKFRQGPVKGKKITCPSCNAENKMGKGTKPQYRLYAKLVLTADQTKEYKATSNEDLENYNKCREVLSSLLSEGEVNLPDLPLEDGYNTQQAINYGFKNWKDFFNDRQLLLLSLLYKEIGKIGDLSTRHLMSMIFSGTLEFNNLFVSYKGEGTGAVRHMFANHILKPERTPIEPNIWGTSKSSGSFSGIFKSKIKRIVEYRNNPKEVHLTENHVASYKIEDKGIRYWKNKTVLRDGSVNLACGDSSIQNLDDKSVDFVVTDPPFFDNVHYSELADFFFSWLRIMPQGFITNGVKTTRSSNEVQDGNEAKFSNKLENVFKTCHRVLKDDGLLIFSYHHSRDEGWTSIARSISNAGFVVENAHPIKAEMSVATPKQQAKEPIQLDILLICKKKSEQVDFSITPDNEIINQASKKAKRLEEQGFKLSRNDLKIILYGQLLKVEGANINERHLNSLINAYFAHQEAISSV